MKRMCKWILALFLTISCVIPRCSVPAQAKTMELLEDCLDVDENCAYLIRDAISGKYLTVANAEAKEGTPICLYTADGVADYNTWYIRDGAIVSAMDDSYNIAMGEQTSAIRAMLCLTQTPNAYQLEWNERDESLFIKGNYQYFHYFVVDSTADGALVKLSTGHATRDKWYLEPVTNQLLGDVNRDGVVNVTDLYQLKQLLQEEISPTVWQKAICDINQDGAVTVADAAAMQDYLLRRDTETLPNRTQFPACTIAPTVSEVPAVEAVNTPVREFAPTIDSTGVVNIPVFLISFPDCPSDVAISKQKAEQLIFGEANPDDPAYPRESVTAYYERSSGGMLHLSGQVYHYAAKNSIDYYAEDKSRLLNEVLSAASEIEDLIIYDRVAVFSVPSSASNADWWPVTYFDPSFQADYFQSGTVIFGNMSLANPMDFNTTLIHELGHAMGLPDYYKYNTPEDSEGFHGVAGCEPMDDMNGEYSAFSKMMFGWYPKEKVQVYRPADGTQTFSIGSTTQNGECLLISPTSNVSNNYFGEYFLLEYVAPDGNAVNSGIGSGGIRIFHVNSLIYNHDEKIGKQWRTNTAFCYENYSPIYKGDDKQRVLRLVNDGGGFFTTGDVIDDTTAGFGWYDDNGAESVETGLQITIGELQDGAYTVTVETK